MMQCSFRIAWPVVALAVFCSLTGLPWLSLAGAAVPTDNPLKKYGLKWTEDIAWTKVVDITTMPGATSDDRFEAAQKKLGEEGGVVYFPAGEYFFHDHLKLAGGVVIRGADPRGTNHARDAKYSLGTRLEFPCYVPKFSGSGTLKETSFKGIELADPSGASNCGVVNVSINRGHIHFGDDAEHQAGRNRIVCGCILQNAALIDERVPDASLGQHAWQRYTKWHQAAIHVYSGENALVANNRLPRSSDSFLMPNYVLKDNPRHGKGIIELKEGVWFDYDNRPAICVNAYGIGGGGGEDPKGTPETYPHGFRKGIVIRENYIYSTGRTAIEFTGDGTIASFNVIRFKPDVPRPTNTGLGVASGSSTNDNRAMTIRGWRYTVEGNDYEVYRNRVYDEPYYINDGEGLMHEGHVNSTVKDSRIIRNKGNSYLSIFLTAGIDGLLIEGNDIRPKGPGTDTQISSIFVVSDRNWDRHYLRNVRIENNTTAGSGISIIGAPASNNLVKGNRHVGERPGVIVNGAEAHLEDNTGYTVKVPEIKKPLADPNRPSATAPAKGK
jgi:hypothetical protein